MNSNLTPVPRTDKNGRVTTRHMKTASTTTSTSTLPPVKLSTASKTAAEKNAALFTLVYGAENNPLVPVNCKKAIKFINKENPGLFEKAAELVDRGDQGGTTSVLSNLMESISLVGAQYGLSDDPDALTLSYERGMNVSHTESLVRAWAIGSVRNDYPNAPFEDFHDNDFQDGLEGLSFILYDDANEDRPKCENDTDYWRGMTAYYITNADPSTDEEKDEGREFAEWAGKQENIKEVIDAALSRGTVNVKTLEGIISTQSTLAPSIRSGAL